MGRHIVCLSVCLSRFRVPSLSFDPLVGLTAQISSMMSRCALQMSEQVQFKVKVIVQGKPLYD